MGIEYPKAAIHCGTCRYWRGDRKLNNVGYYVLKDSRIRGTCSKPGNVRCGKDMQAYESCSQWTKG